MRLIDLYPEVSDKTVSVTGVSDDSRTIQKDMIFVAVSGHKNNGHDFIQKAINAGAVAIIAERKIDGDMGGAVLIIRKNARAELSRLAQKFYPKQPHTLVAVTGTNGKTSVADFLRQIWRQAAWNSASIGTLGLRGGNINNGANGAADGLSSLGSWGGLTTPDAVSLHRTLNTLTENGITNLALEASSHGIEQDRLSSAVLTAAGFTNLTRDHLDHHNDMEAYFETKARLFTELLPRGGGAVININDQYGKELAQRLKGREINVMTIGHDEKADLHIKSIDAFDGGMTIKIIVGGNDMTIPLAMIGEFQAENALMAAALAHVAGLSITHALLTLPYLKAAPGRMQTVHGHPKGGTVLVDYAHTPDALELALKAVRHTIKGRVGVIFGCGGDRDKGKRLAMGKIAHAHADFAIITDDNPRGEDAAAIRNAIISAAPPNAPNMTNIGNRHDAIQYGLNMLGSDDALLIAGKGHESDQLVGTETLPFSDEAAAIAIIANMQDRGAL